ncbi:hypothetical protein ACFS7Z_19765 [Pontibacter toksunensis]|uniref:Uncharacterized protein n=1 Tax=Pontibacter toksunensis TaxID=1332631 RepID=A0ABW6BY67_9BACT
MIEVKHPEPSRNTAQEIIIKQFPEEERRLHELFFSYNNASYIYHLEPPEQEPTHLDYEEWLAELSEPIRKALEIRGVEECRLLPDFIRYINEKRDLEEEEFICSLMGRENYQEYKALME